MLEDYVDDRAKGFEKSAFLVGGEGRTPLLICCIVCCTNSFSIVHSSPSFDGRDEWYTPSASPDSFGAGEEEPECSKFPSTFQWTLHHLLYRASARALSSAL